MTELSTDKLPKVTPCIARPKPRRESMMRFQHIIHIFLRQNSAFIEKVLNLSSKRLIMWKFDDNALNTLWNTTLAFLLCVSMYHAHQLIFSSHIDNSKSYWDIHIVWRRMFKLKEKNLYQYLWSRISETIWFLYISIFSNFKLLLKS